MRMCGRPCVVDGTTARAVDDAAVGVFDGAGYGIVGTGGDIVKGGGGFGAI